MKDPKEIAALLKVRHDLKHLDVGPDGLTFIIGQIRVIVSTGEGWDHVSVSLAHRCPRYEEMKMVKRLCFKPDEWAFELHAPPSKHISIHPYVLHLWRPQNVPIPLPDEKMV